MSAADQEAALVARYMLIPDIQERLMAAGSHSGSVTTLEESARRDALLVPGCQSRVWLDVKAPEGLLSIRLASDSLLVRGLAALVCDVFSGLPAVEAASSATTIIEALRFDRVVSPTRLNGLASVQTALRARAAALAKDETQQP